MCVCGKGHSSTGELAILVPVTVKYFQHRFNVLDEILDRGKSIKKKYLTMCLHS